ncbi:galactose mutarotase-like domain-containing protein [Vararia minispora EC-137]|uniref:Galactose mutarotase-like domain-containing protein n=1 Tax=Vararia minispora EC-137 TaxID=1314806 RepID=A0ACB8QNL5_9AGAM|nr:galactose mutarotase-like domain-containing protein [Vararia minispora EC-137]
MPMLKSQLIYNGKRVNYGAGYLTDVANLEIVAADTQYQADEASRSAVLKLLEGNLWTIFRNAKTDILHWDYSVLGRFITLLTVDSAAATSGLQLNLTEIEVIGKLWNSSEAVDFSKSLLKPTKDANSGKIKGNHMFYTNDYMVRRGKGYVSTLKMYSTRTRNTECSNFQGGSGFHLSDGTLYTLVTGVEYESVFAAWDWNLIPGDCDTTKLFSSEAFIGGSSNGELGVAAMRYLTPQNKTLGWQKTWFFLPDDVQHVMIAGVILDTTISCASVLSVLDQRHRAGHILVEGKSVKSGNFSSVSTLFHGGIGYTFNRSNTAVSLSIDSGQRTGNWTGISGGVWRESNTVDLFAAWLEHTDLDVYVEYTVYPALTPDLFRRKAAKSDLLTIHNDESVSAILAQKNHVAMFVFWDSEGGNASVPSYDG